MCSPSLSFVFFFFFNDTATTEIYPLSLHDALPILVRVDRRGEADGPAYHPLHPRSEEHTSELQSRLHLVCRLLLEKKKQDAPRRHGAPPCGRGSIDAPGITIP